MALSRSNPYGLTLRNAMDQLLAQSFVTPSWFMGQQQATIAPMNVYETNNGYEVQIALPGVKSQDIDLTVQQNTLDIKGRFGYLGPVTQEAMQAGKMVESQPTQQSQTSAQQASSQQAQQPQQASGQQSQQDQGRFNVLLQEIPTGAFERTITFPRPIDANSIRTTLEDGILTIWVPISEENRPRKINVQSGQSGQSQQVPVS